MAVQTKSLSELTDQAIRLLVREMGPTDAARVIGQFSMGSGDYTEERKERFKDLTIDEIVQEIERSRD